jgi:ABC-type glycerol-3-phosphate transport system substrate-binding protein
MRALFAGSILFLSVWGVGMVMTSRDPVPAGKTEIVWVSDDTPIRRAQIDLFNRLNPDLHLKLDPGNRGSNKVIVQSLGGVGPDVFDVTGTELAIYVNAGIALDVTEELRTRGIDPDRQFWPASKPLFRHEGKDYGVPANLDTTALLYNKAILEAEGVPLPSANPTWEEIVALGKRLTKTGPDGQPERYGLLFWFDTRDFLAMEGAQLFSDDGTAITVNTPNALRALERMRDLVYTHKISPSPTASNAMSNQGGWGGGNEGQFVAGRAAMVIGPRYFTAHFRRAGGMRVGVATLPLSPGGSTRVRGRTVTINSRTKHKEAALRFLEFVAGPDYNRLNNDLADGMGPVMSYTTEPGFLFNPQFPEEKSNPAWRKALLAAGPDQTSPFLTNAQMDEATWLHMDLMNAGKKAPAKALEDIQTAAERKMAENLRENKDLAEAHRRLKREQSR